MNELQRVEGTFFERRLNSVAEYEDQLADNRLRISDTTLRYARPEAFMPPMWQERRELIRDNWRLCRIQDLCEPHEYDEQFQLKTRALSWKPMVQMPLNFILPRFEYCDTDARGLTFTELPNSVLFDDILIDNLSEPPELDPNGDINLIRMARIAMDYVPYNADRAYREAEDGVLGSITTVPVRVSDSELNQVRENLTNLPRPASFTKFRKEFNARVTRVRMRRRFQFFYQAVLLHWRSLVYAPCDFVCRAAVKGGLQNHEWPLAQQEHVGQAWLQRFCAATHHGVDKRKFYRESWRIFGCLHMSRNILAGFLHGLASQLTDNHLCRKQTGWILRKMSSMPEKEYAITTMSRVLGRRQRRRTALLKSKVKHVYYARCCEMYRELDPTIYQKYPQHRKLTMCTGVDMGKFLRRLSELDEQNRHVVRTNGLDDGTVKTPSQYANLVPVRYDSLVQ